MDAGVLRIRRRRRHRAIFLQLRVPRVFCDRQNPLEVLREEEVFRRYRFHPATIVFILGLLPDLSRPTQRSMPLPPLLQLLVTLRFLATGSIHLLVGDSVSISRSTAGRCIRTVAVHLRELAGRFVSFPVGPAANEVRQGFAAIAGFPNVLGCVDGTFIPLQKPKENENDYVNRKGFHSLNVQMVCDHRFRITSLAAEWPGSVHDSRIFRQSGLCANFENGRHRGFLLGDSGYPCRYFLMIPFLNPSVGPEERYNRALCRTRVLIEQCFGILKRRFQVLHTPMRTQPPRAVTYTAACVVLHNIGIERGDIISVDEEQNEGDAPPEQAQDVQDGMATRRHIVEAFFT